jgi:ribosomal RNA-processing protein 8
MGKNKNNARKNKGGNVNKRSTEHPKHKYGLQVNGGKLANANNRHNRSAAPTPSALKGSASSSTPSSSSSSGGSSSSRLSALQQKFKAKLEGSRFRIINEKLYTSTGDEALSDFKNDPDQFDAYHVGFREQASQWPVNPLDGIIEWIKRKHRQSIIADMGCGDARLAQSVPNKVHSFDLVSRSDLVIAADIAHVPLPEESVDIVVFCLALMGTNIVDFIIEAHRILKPGGVMKIVEVRSRFEAEKEGAKKFIRIVKKAGFDIASEKNNAINAMFFMIECTKSGRPSQIASNAALAEYSAKPCVYKKR